MDELKDRVREAVARASGAQVEVGALSPLPGGACQDLFRVEMVVGGEPLRMVLRSDARRSLPGSVGRAVEHAVIAAAVREGVPTPAARWLTADLLRPGAWAWFMDHVDGVAIGAKVVRDPALAAARERLPAQLAQALAAVHRVTAVPVLPAVADPQAVALDFVVRMIDLLPEPHPAMELALAWLRAHRPAAREVTLVHGDFRTGNFLVGPEGLTAVLDWEFAHLGDPMEDIGWLCVRDWRFGALNRPVGGIADRETFYAAYEQASGRGVDRAAVRWWEVLGNLRWAAGAVYQGERYLSGEEADLELLAIARRAAEMEFECLRLLGEG